MRLPNSAPMPLLALGFRPFYLLACIYALLSVPLWLARYLGIFPMTGYLAGAVWHGHELVFGFAAAVISGFLLTAVKNWTQRPTASGGYLGALASLWIAGRVLVWTGPGPLAALVDLAFLPALAIAIGIPLIQTRNSNWFVLVVIGVLTLVNAAIHLHQLELFTVAAFPDAMDAAFDVLAILMAVIAGRVTPLFIGNAVRGSTPKRLRPLEFASVGLLALILVIDALQPGSDSDHRLLLAALFVATAGVHGLRVALWSPLATVREPLLWILPLSYSWIPIWLLLRAAAELEFAPATLAHHALGIGAMASLMLGMMTRSALGHTGRPLRAGATETSAFVLIQLAVLLRILPLLVYPSFYQAGLTWSAACWTGAFVVVVIKYAPILLRPRIDGQPG